MKYLIFALLISGFIFAIVFLSRDKGVLPENTGHEPNQHIYSSWDVMEFDKCVAVWLIVRFIDKDAQFVFYPQGTEINKGIPFEVPEAAWSRKHLKCTSQCILDTIKNPDPALKKIVSMAGQIELNFWQLNEWPQTQKCFYEVRNIIESGKPPECYEKTNLYFDTLYNRLKNDNLDLKKR